MKMTCKLQMVITFITVVCLRSTLCQNTQNLEENPRVNPKIDWVYEFCQKKKEPLTA